MVHSKNRDISLNGVVTAMSDGKCFDVHILSDCKICRIWEQTRIGQTRI